MIASDRAVRFATGVPNLDLILGGGLLPGTVAMVIGPPGSGKTILAQQIAFHRAKAGDVALYFTGYSETHEKLLAHNRSLTFFDSEAIGTRIQMGSLPDLLEQGADTAERAVLGTARRRKARLVVMDGFRSIRGFLPDDQAAAQFLYSLGAKLAQIGATLLVLVEGDATDRIRDPEQSVCDVILSLTRERQGESHRRMLEVLKVRGAAPLNGVHPFTIDANGITVFPRLESIVPVVDRPWTGGRAAFGIPRVDAMLEGGVNVGTITLAAGTPGIGKTLLGLHFLAEGARLDEPGLLIGFTENRVQLHEKARRFGLLHAFQRQDGADPCVQIQIIPPHDLDPDRVAWQVRTLSEAYGTRRLVIDSVTELDRAFATPQRSAVFLAALVSYLRSRDLTTYLTVDVPTIVGPELSFAGTPLAVLAENLILLRYAEYQGELHRLFSVLKMRFSNFDRTLYEYDIVDGQGFRIGARAPRAEGLLTGLARPLGGSATDQEPPTRRTRRSSAGTADPEQDASRGR